MRIVRFLEKVGVTSGRKAINLIDQGFCRVNGEIISEPWILVNPKPNLITLREKELNLLEKFTYILLNKPKGIITTCADEHGRKIVLNLNDSTIGGLVSVDRLDKV